MSTEQRQAAVQAAVLAGVFFPGAFLKMPAAPVTSDAVQRGAYCPAHVCFYDPEGRCPMCADAAAAAMNGSKGV